MAVEYRGCRGLVAALITKDDATGYETGEVFPLAPIGEISKSVETSSATHYYDNKAAIVIDSEGTDTATFTVAIPDDETLALITGRVYNAETKQYIEAPRTQNYFAVGYILGEIGEGEEENFVWRYKGTFNIPDEASKTKDDSTDASNMSLVYTGIYTQHQFANGGGTGVAKSAKAMKMKASDITETAFFENVFTPDSEIPEPNPKQTRTRLVERCKDEL